MSLVMLIGAVAFYVTAYLVLLHREFPGPRFGIAPWRAAATYRLGGDIRTSSAPGPMDDFTRRAFAPLERLDRNFFPDRWEDWMLPPELNGIARRQQQLWERLRASGTRVPSEVEAQVEPMQRAWLGVENAWSAVSLARNPTPEQRRAVERAIDDVKREARAFELALRNAGL